MQNIVIAKPYRFVPPRFSRFWSGLVGCFLPAYLRRSHGVVSVVFHGADQLAHSLKAGWGVLLASNHCRPCDPMVLGMLARHVGRPFHIMASWHLFMQNPVQTYLLPRIGIFSVHREGLDRESLKCATQLLAQARFPLVIFPEGFITRNNDRLYNLMDGCAFLARTAARQRATLSPAGKVVIHPVFIRYQFKGDIEATLLPIIERIEARLAWRPQTHLPLVERVIRIGYGLLTLKEIEHLGHPGSGSAPQRLRHLMDHLLAPMEREWDPGSQESDPMLRIKRLRSAIVPDIVHGDLTEAETARRWKHLSNLYLAQQLHCYSGDTLAHAPTPERLLETVERYEEDLTDKTGPHPPIHAVVSVGPPLEAPPGRDRRADPDPVAAELRSHLERMLAAGRQPQDPSQPSTPP